jgi:nitroimidazol reductase NimA-like FMN-containing flavoprotein (pyridoxamine 5'-phosphate oxidase superfamily)
MRIAGTSQDECRELLRRLSVGRLACALDNRLYVVHVRFAYEPEHLYVFSTMEQKIEWMRKNPIVCLTNGRNPRPFQLDECGCERQVP